MTDLRKAAQQALEALEYAEANHGGDDCYADSITALRAALAEPQSTHSADCYKWHHECAIARIEETEELREALKTALAESEKLSKPVAWMHTNGVGHVYFRKKPQDKVFNPRPVYLHPKTLTDEDISVLWHQSGEQPFKFARMLLK